MGQILLIYDIPNDRVRSKVADACLDYGLDRIQFSAFSGRLNRNHQEELFLKIQALLDDEAGKVWLMPIGDQEWKQRLALEVGDVGS